LGRSVRLEGQQESPLPVENGHKTPAKQQCK
jgi:hypothetical protein